MQNTIRKSIYYKSLRTLHFFTYDSCVSVKPIHFKPVIKYIFFNIRMLLFMLSKLIGKWNAKSLKKLGYHIILKSTKEIEAKYILVNVKKKFIIKMSRRDADSPGLWTWGRISTFVYTSIKRTHVELTKKLRSYRDK